MVTLKNNFGDEADKDNPVMNVSEGTVNDAKSPVCGHPKAILNCRRNSHPFQTRTLILNTPAKIGRSVARARPSCCNGIFDCKVLSRNHAIIWYEYEAGKFMIQDTKSSNGTFVNNQRLSKGGETSLPREFFSRDIVQFGVDVLENQRKGSESDNSDESNHIVTHGCIVATVKLFHPNGKESRSGQPYITPEPIMPISQDKICKLELIIHEAQQREGRLHEKLEELQLIVNKLEIACQDTLTNRFEETRLLSKIANLEKQTKVMSKVLSGNGGKTSEKVEFEIQQLLIDIEKLQISAREIQERQHRKLLESEQKLIEVQRVATNLEQEVIALREQASLTELHLQEMGAKCTTYCQTIDILKNNYHSQIELTQKLEAQVAKFEEREGEQELRNKCQDPGLLDEYKFIIDEGETDVGKKEKENQDIILEKCKRLRECDKADENDFFSEDEKTEWLTKKIDSIFSAVCDELEHVSNYIGQLEGTLADAERSKKKVEKLCIRGQAISLELEAAKMPSKEIEKTENEIFKSVSLPSVSNEKLTDLEIELEENEELLSQARFKVRESEGKYAKLKCDLDAAIKRCEKLILESSNLNVLLKNHLRINGENSKILKETVDKLKSEIEALKIGHEEILVDFIEKEPTKKETRETQTQSGYWLSNSSDGVGTPAQIENAKKTEFNMLHSAEKQPQFLDNVLTSKENKAKLILSDISEKFEMDGSLEENFDIFRITNNEKNKIELHNAGSWEKIRKIQNLLSDTEVFGSPASIHVKELKMLINLLAEDLVYLLLREQQISKDNHCLQRKLNKASYCDEIPSFGLVGHIRTIILFPLIAIAAFFVYMLFL